MMRLVLLVLLPALIFPARPAHAKNEDKARVLLHGKAPIGALAYAPDGATLASADESGRLTLTEVASGKVTRDFRYKTAVKSLAFAPDGKLLAVGVGREVRLLNPNSEMKKAAPVRVLKLQKTVGSSLQFSQDGRILLAIEASYAGKDGYDYAVNIWNVATGERLRHYRPKYTESYSAALSPNGKQFVASTDVATVALFDVEHGQKIRELSNDFSDNTNNTGFYIHALAFSPDGKWIVGAGGFMESSGNLTLWETKSGVAKWNRVIADYGNAIAWSPDSSRVIAGTSYDTTYDDPDKLHRPTGAPIFTSSGQWQRSLQRAPGAINAIAWAPDGKTLATGAEDGAVRLWKVG